MYVDIQLTPPPPPSQDIIAEFDPADPYWTSADVEEDELVELLSDPTGSYGSPIPPRPASLHLDIVSPPRPAAPEEEETGPAPSEAGAPLLGPEQDGDDESSDLLPEMRAILTQLQNKR